MEAERTINFNLNSDIRAYESFFDPAWHDTILGLAANSPKLADAVVALSVSWYATANAFAMPWRMVHNLIGYERGFLRGEKSIKNRIFAALALAIPQKMGSNLSNMKRQRLADVIREVGEELVEATDTITAPEADEVFGKLLAGPDGTELQISIWGSQRTCYSALYFAYENFLTTCVAVAKNNANYQNPPFPKFKEEARAVFGNAIADRCFDDSVKLASMVRNALAHTGGKATKLKGLVHDFPIFDDTIHVLAAHNHTLFNALKERALKLAEKASTMTQFR